MPTDPQVILTSYYRFKPGGYCSRLRRALLALLQAGHEVHYLALEPFPLDHPRCHFHRLPWFNRHGDSLAFWAWLHAMAPLLLAWLAVRRRVTRCFAFGASYGAILRIAARLRRAPLTVFFRGDPLEHHRLAGRPDWLVRAEHIVEAIALGGSHARFVSQTLAERVAGRHPGARPASSGVLPNDIPRCPARRADSTPGSLRLACVGTFDVEKNLGLALACLGELEDGYELHLFGTGPEETRLRALAASLGVARRVHWHGWVADPERVWRGIDLLLFPSLREGSPNAVLEALACGIPVLALRVDELAEILPASTLAPDAPGAWAAKVRDWRNRLADVAGEQSRYAMRLNYDWDRAVVDALISPPTHGSSGQSSGQSSG